MTTSIRAGRPTEADVPHIARVALRLFEEKGFDAVTMDEVARAAAVSRRTLFRHFPSKSDLVWAGADEAVSVLTSLAAPLEDRKVGVADVVRELFLPVLTLLDDPQMEAVARRRLTLMAGAPTLWNHPTLLGIEGVLANVLSPRALPSGAPPALAAHTLVSAAFASLLWWAQHGHGRRAGDVAVAALQAIRV